MRDNKGQNIIEYILLSVAAILVFVLILQPRTGALNNSVNRTLNSTLNSLDQLSQKIVIQ